MSKKTLDLYDIQGNICKGYGRFGFPKARYCFLHFSDTAEAKLFLLDIINKITTAEPWTTTEEPATETSTHKESNKPSATMNIAFTYTGLASLKLPERSLKGFPVDFTMGMAARNVLLGDTGVSAPDQWDDIWQEGKVHAWVSLNGESDSAIADQFSKLQVSLKNFPSVELLSGHKGPNGSTLNYQDASAVFENGLPTAKEHFGFTDGIGNPYFEGCGNNPDRIPGRGKLMRDGSWQPLATGEFILGHPDEAREYPPAAEPKLLSRNGTFMVYRKLHENVDTFNNYIDDLAKNFDGSKDLLMAKMSGRWPDNGAPLTLAATDAEKANLDKQYSELKEKALSGNEYDVFRFQKLQSQWIDFTFKDDVSGSKCPIGAHIRRTNTRGSLETQEDAYNRPGALIDRRRLMRRGLPYGGIEETPSDKTEQGIIFMSIGASIERQFEFVQQQWVNYSNDFKLGNDRDPLIGSHNGKLTDKHLIQACEEKRKEGKQPPFFCTELPRFVETRGGDYFFIPSITALRMIAESMIDPS